MELINIFLAVAALWLAGGLLAAVFVGFALLLIWLGVVGIRRLLRQVT